MAPGEYTRVYIVGANIPEKKINGNFCPECVLDTAKYKESAGTFGALIVRHRKLISLKLTPLAFTV